MKKRIEIASDMGESFGNYVLGRAEEVMKLINTAFVACGWHAGDPLVMHQTVKLCKQYNVVLGAHPGLPDLMGFGRRYMAITEEEARNYIIYQVGALKNFADYVGIKIRTAKPHGALFSWALENEDHARAVVEGLMSIGPDLEAIHGTPKNVLREATLKAGLRFITEFYPGLLYAADGKVIVTRTYKSDPEAETKRVLKWLKTGKVDTVEGKEIQVEAETIEVHGDIPNCPEVLLSIREALDKEGVEIRAALE